MHVSLLCVPAYAEGARDIGSLFAQEQVNGTLLVSRLDGNPDFVHDEARARVAYPVASTFKIFNSLIAIDTGIITSLNDVIRWDGRAHPDFPDWNRDRSRDLPDETE